MTSATSHIIIGRIGTTYGVHGWLKIHSFAENILSYSPWYLASEQNDTNWLETIIEDSKKHNKGIIVKLKTIDTPEKARLFTGKWIGIQRAQLPELGKNEYYWSDLVGLTVINQHGQILGNVAYLIETGANDVLVVKNDKHEEAIPYLMGSVIIRIDLIKQEIHVNWESIS